MQDYINKTPGKLFTEIKEISQPPKEIFQSSFGERFWLKSHGKEEYINFTDDALLELRKYFDSLDEKETGSIGVEQLEDPFIAFGLSESRKDVEDLIKCKVFFDAAVDLDGSGTIEFDEFLEIMSNIKKNKDSQNSKNSAILDFFKKLSLGELGQQFDKSMTFRLNVSQYRRRRILESMMSTNKDVKDKSTKIMQNFKKQIIASSTMKEALLQSKKSSIFAHGFEIKGVKRTIK